jgi:hypothetical protein
MCGRIGQADFVKALHRWGGPGFDPHGPHKILNNKPIANKGVPRGSP